MPMIYLFEVRRHGERFDETHTEWAESAAVIWRKYQRHNTGVGMSVKKLAANTYRRRPPPKRR